MEELLPIVTLKHLAWAPVFQTATLFIGTFTSFIVAFNHGSVSAFFPFFSETGAHSPEVCIFSFTLYLGSFFGFMVVVYRYIVLKHVVSKQQKRLRQLNLASLCCGTCSMIGLAGVAAIPMSTVYVAHLTAAGLHFMFATFFIALQTYLTFRTQGVHALMTKARIAIFAILLVVLLIMVILFPLSHREWRKHNEKPAALKMPSDDGFALLLSSALFEWLLYATFLLYIASFVPDLYRYQIMISVLPKDN